MTTEMLTVLEIIKKTTDFFTAKGVESPRLNAELLVGHGLGLKRMQLYLQFERLLTATELEAIRPLVRRRGQREPLQYILGETEFFGLKLKTDRRALIPRPETEYLIELLVGKLAAPPARILDLGTGTGAIILALGKNYPEAGLTAVDLSSDALSLAAENAVANQMGDRVTWINSDWFTAVPDAQKFDLIVANPPYLSEEETTETTPEVQSHEPAHALTSAGGDGTRDLKLIIQQAPQFLTPGGLLALETGIAQHAVLTACATEAGFPAVESLKDLTQRERYIFAAMAVA
ncbi:MAG: peptide chain release factor N(5)-glutamine methyltransferase [Opitutus sp.]